MERGNRKRTPIRPWAWLILAIVVVWGRTVVYDFVWDDATYIVENFALREPANLWGFFSRAETQQSVSPYPYRPLRTLHFALMIWPTARPTAWIFHLANLFWHTAATVLLYLLLHLLLERVDPGGKHSDLVALIPALGFAVHPLASETVAWAKCLDDLMATALILASFVAAWKAWGGKAGPKAGLLSCSVLFFAASLYSKGSAVVLVLLYPFLFLAVPGRPPLRRAVTWLTALAATAAVYLVTRHLVLGGTAQIATHLSGSRSQTMIDMLPVVTLYMAKMIGVPPFLPDYSFMQGGYALLSLPVLCGAALLVFAGLVLMGAFVGYCRGQTSCLPVWWGGLWIACSLVPVSNLVPMMQYFAERFAYLPLAGLMMALVTPLAWLFRASPRMRFCMLAVPLAWAALSLRESAKWRDELTLMEYAYQVSPYSERIAANYATELFNAGRVGEAKAIVADHPALPERRPKLRWMQARVMRKEGRMEEALEIMLELESRFRGAPDFAVDLAALRAENGELEEAHERLQSAVTRWPYHVNAWANLGRCLNEQKAYPEAVAACRRALALDEQQAETWKTLLHAAWKLENWAVAREALTRLKQLEPSNPQHAYWLDRLPDS